MTEQPYVNCGAAGSHGNPERSERPVPTTDAGPHSRACGARVHLHGSACSTNCPTCHGATSVQMPSPQVPELTPEQRRQRMCPCTLEPSMPTPQPLTREQIAEAMENADLSTYEAPSWGDYLLMADAVLALIQNGADR